MAEVHATLRRSPCRSSERERIALTERRERWEAGEPGRRWPVKAASRRSRARAARALTGLRRSGMGSPSGSVAGGRPGRQEKSAAFGRAQVVGRIVRICWHLKLPCWPFRWKGLSFQRGGRRRRSAVSMRCARSFDFASFLGIRTLRLRNAHCAKSLIFRPSAAERPAKRLRLLSCHRTVGLPQLHQTCDKVRYSANDGQPAIKRCAEQNRRTSDS